MGFLETHELALATVVQNPHNVHNTLCPASVWPHRHVVSEAHTRIVRVLSHSALHRVTAGAIPRVEKDVAWNVVRRSHPLFGRGGSPPSRDNSVSITMMTSVRSPPVASVSSSHADSKSLYSHWSSAASFPLAGQKQGILCKTPKTSPSGRCCLFPERPPSRTRSYYHKNGRTSKMMMTRVSELGWMQL